MGSVVNVQLPHYSKWHVVPLRVVHEMARHQTPYVLKVIGCYGPICLPGSRCKSVRCRPRLAMGDSHILQFHLNDPKYMDRVYSIDFEVTQGGK